jgi:hypothetical protein
MPIGVLAHHGSDRARLVPVRRAGCPAFARECWVKLGHVDRTSMINIWTINTWTRTFRRPQYACGLIGSAEP